MDRWKASAALSGSPPTAVRASVSTCVALVVSASRAGCKNCSPILTASKLRVTLPNSYSGRRGRSTLDDVLLERAEDLRGLRARAVGDRPVGGYDARRWLSRPPPTTHTPVSWGPCSTSCAASATSEQILLGERSSCRHRTRSAAGRLRESDPEATVSRALLRLRRSYPFSRVSPSAVESGPALSRIWSQVAQQEAPSWNGRGL